MSILDIEEIKKTEIQNSKMETKRENLTTMPSLTTMQILVSWWLTQKLIVGKVRRDQKVEKQHVYCIFLRIFIHTLRGHMSTPRGIFLWSIILVFYVSCALFSLLLLFFLWFVSLRSTSQVQCCQCLWIVHYWLPVRFSLTFIYMSYWHLCLRDIIVSI